MPRRRPKALVQVFKGSDNRWDYHCLRCQDFGWDHTWPSALDRALQHLDVHTDVGFSPPKG